MQLGSDFYFTCRLLYMFRALLAPIIRSITTVYAAPGASAPSYVAGYELPRREVVVRCALVTGAAYTVVIVLMMGARSARNM